MPVPRMHATENPARGRCGLLAARRGRNTPACRGGCAAAAMRRGAARAAATDAKDRKRHSCFVPLFEPAQLGAQLSYRKRIGRPSRAEEAFVRLREETLDCLAHGLEVRRPAEQIG